MRLILTGAACAVLFLSGCGGSAEYDRPDAGKGQRDRDTAECQWEAARATGNLPNADYEKRSRELFDKCMQARGYARK